MFPAISCTLWRIVVPDVEHRTPSTSSEIICFAQAVCLCNFCNAQNKIFDANKSVSDIAYESGFKYTQHFTRVFKQHTGVTPQEYRRSLNQESFCVDDNVVKSLGETSIPSLNPKIIHRVCIGRLQSL
jgi:hypothetical protein